MQGQMGRYELFRKTEPLLLLLVCHRTISEVAYRLPRHERICGQCLVRPDTHALAQNNDELIQILSEEWDVIPNHESIHILS